MWEGGTIWEGAREGRLVLGACADCGELCHPPLPMCPGCQSNSRVARAVSGRASLVSWLVSTHPGDSSAQPRVVIVVRLEEGVNFVSNLICAQLDQLHEGMALELCFQPDEAGLVLPLFRPAENAA